MCLSTQMHNFEGVVEAEELVKNLSIVKHILSRDNERSAQAGLRRKGPIISLGIWTEQPNDEEDQMLCHQRSEPVCARAKRRPITKKVLPCWSFYIQLWDLVAAPGFWAPRDHQSVRWSHFTQNQVQHVIQTS